MHGIIQDNTTVSLCFVDNKIQAEVAGKGNGAVMESVRSGG